MRTTPKEAAPRKAELAAYLSIGAAVMFIMAVTLGVFDAPDQRTVASNQSATETSVAR